MGPPEMPTGARVHGLAREGLCEWTCKRPHRTLDWEARLLCPGGGEVGRVREKACEHCAEARPCVHS